MDFPRDNALTFLFSTYKRTAGIAFAAILLIAIPVSLALLGQQQDVRQRASTAVSENLCDVRPACLDEDPPCATVSDTGRYCPADTGDVGGTYRWIGTCTSGCTGSHTHILQITKKDLTNRSFSGIAYYVANPLATWVFNAQFEGNTNEFTFNLAYNNESIGYVGSGTGVLGEEGILSGSLEASGNQEATFVANPISCVKLPNNCTIAANGTASCPAGTTAPTKTSSQYWCPVRDYSCASDSMCTLGETCLGEGSDKACTTRVANTSCSTNSDCDTGYRCAVVGTTESYPPTDIKQCVLNTDRGRPASSSAIFDLNDDGRVNAIDTNMFYSNFKSRNGD